MGFAIGAPRLAAVVCPHCSRRAGTVVLETGPVLIKHDRRWTQGGAKRHCRETFVAIPQREDGRVRLVPVSGRREADRVLLAASEQYLERRAREVSIMIAEAQAVEDVYGVKL